VRDSENLINIKDNRSTSCRSHYIQGLKNLEEAIAPDIYDKSLIDEKVMIESGEAFEMACHIIQKKMCQLV